MTLRRPWLCGLVLASACGGSSGAASGRDAGSSDATSGVEAGASDGGLDGATVTDAAGDGLEEAGPVVTGTIAITPTKTVAPLPVGMVGLSYEKSHLTDGYFTGTNASLVAMLQLLGPQLLRVGGNSVDETMWYTDPGDAGAASIITQADVDGLSALVAKAGWTVLYGVNMKTSNPTVAAAETTYAAKSLGKSLYGFEIGNEVDLYTSTALSATWSYPIFKTQWESFETAVEGKTGGMPMTGPASASHYSTWTVPFAGDEGSRIILLTQHYYRANGQLATSTLDLLLQPDPALVTELQALSAAVKSASAGGEDSVSQYRISECNSFYNGGAPNISDAFGTALWAIDYLFTNALYGSSGANFHGGGNGPGYTPIADANGAVVGARPIFYGLLFFSKIGAGNMVSTTAALAQSLNFTAYTVQAAAAADASLNVVLVNKDAAATVHATVSTGIDVASATVTRLEGPALDATTGVTLGGAAIDPTGSWSPVAPAALPVAGQSVTVDVPPASAALVHVVAQ